MTSARNATGPCLRRAACLLLLAAVAAAALPAAASAEQASQPSSAAAGQVDSGDRHSCAIVAGAVRCWGYGGEGRLGYGNTDSIGDNETPGAVPPVDVGPGRTATALVAGLFHTCALLDNGTVRCWGWNQNGELGAGNTNAIGDNETPGSRPPVDLGTGRTAKAITAGRAHTCAILDNNTVRCWGHGIAGQLGYGNADQVGNDESPGSVGPVDLGMGRTAKVISAGDFHTCVIMDDDNVRCWGYSGGFALGYVLPSGIQPGDGLGDNELPTSVGPVDLGGGRTARAIAAGGSHTCVILHTVNPGAVQCWGRGDSGRLGYGNTQNVAGGITVGNPAVFVPNPQPSDIGPLNLGARTAKAIAAGGDHTCAVLNDDMMRCWGAGTFGQLGYPGVSTLGDTAIPALATIAPVAIGAGRTVAAIAPATQHTCARLDDGAVRCWGRGTNGRLGYCNELIVGDNETPATVGPVDFTTANVGCPVGPRPPTGDGSPGDDLAATPETPPAPTPGVAGPSATALGLAREAQRRQRLRGCLRAAARRPRSRRARARRDCNRQHGRTPGGVSGLRVRAAARRRAVLSFRATGSDGANPPAARSYLITQTRRSLSGRRVGRPKRLCGGSCRFSVTDIGAPLSLTITDLRPRSVYTYSIRARDNVTRRLGRRAATARLRMR